MMAPRLSDGKDKKMDKLSLLIDKTKDLESQRISLKPLVDTKKITEFKINEIGEIQ